MIKVLVVGEKAVFYDLSNTRHCKAYLNDKQTYETSGVSVVEYNVSPCVEPVKRVRKDA